MQSFTIKHGGLFILQAITGTVKGHLLAWNVSTNTILVKVQNQYRVYSVWKPKLQGNSLIGGNAGELLRYTPKEGDL